MIIIFLGQPGSGKGTQAKLLGDYLKISSYSMGQLLREEYDKKTKEGILAEKYWGEKGINVPTNISFPILKNYLDKKNNFILDNFPRTPANLEYFKKYLAKRKLAVNYVFHLSISKKEAVKRLLKRAVIDEKKFGKKRLDETEELIRVRYEKGYETEIPAVLQYYRRQKILFEFDGSEKIKDIHKKIIRVIKKSAEEPT